MQIHRVLYAVAACIALWLIITIAQRPEKERARREKEWYAEAARSGANIRWQFKKMCLEARKSALKSLFVGIAAHESERDRDACRRAVESYASIEEAANAHPTPGPSPSSAKLILSDFGYSNDAWKGSMIRLSKDCELALAEIERSLASGE